MFYPQKYNTSCNPNVEVTLSFVEFTLSINLKNTYPLIVMERLFEPTLDFICYVQKKTLNNNRRTIKYAEQ